VDRHLDRVPVLVLADFNAGIFERYRELASLAAIHCTDERVP